MKPKKILFCGLGGAGQRHLRIFHALLGDSTSYIAYRSHFRTPTLNPDFSVNKDDTLESKYGVKVFSDLAQAWAEKPDLVVISTPSSKHLEFAQEAASRGIHVFVEKPFSDSLRGFAEYQRIAREHRILTFVGFQRRFHPQIQRAKVIVESGALGRILGAHFNVFSYVPAWHPYEDFRELYACRKDLGGGVLLTEIHEIDLCYWFFGKPKSVFALGGNRSEVKLDVEDTVDLSFDYGDFGVQMHLSIMSPKSDRDFWVNGTKGFLEWRASTCQLTFTPHGGGEKLVSVDKDFKNDDMFFAQARNLIDKFDPAASDRHLDAAYQTLAMVEAAKESMRKREVLRFAQDDGGRRSSS